MKKKTTKKELNVIVHNKPTKKEAYEKIASLTIFLKELYTSSQ